jgi:hypothetical protein
VRTQIRCQRYRCAEAEQHAQRVHGSVDNRDAELVQERRGDEIQQGEEPPQANEKRVVDDRVGAVVRAVDVVSHEGNDEDGADLLSSR